MRRPFFGRDDAAGFEAGRFGGAAGRAATFRAGTAVEGCVEGVAGSGGAGSLGGTTATGSGATGGGSAVGAKVGAAVSAIAEDAGWGSPPLASRTRAIAPIAATSVTPRTPSTIAVRRLGSGETTRWLASAPG